MNPTTPGYFTVEQIAVDGFDHNFSYLVLAPNGDAALLDPTGDLNKIQQCLDRFATQPLHVKYILLTHSHRDHITGAQSFQERLQVPVYGHPRSRLTGVEFEPLRDGERLPLGDGWIECLYTPGHTVDSVSYHLSDESGLFTGDTLFIGCCGYCEAKSMFASLRRLKELPGSNQIYSGHDYGETPTASLETERHNNPYLSTEDFSIFQEKLKEL